MSGTNDPVSSAQVVANVIDTGSISRQQLLVAGLCLVFNMLDGFDITAMAVVATTVSAELQLSPDRLGLIFSFALAGMMGGAMLLAPLSDIIGRRKMIILSVLLVGVSMLLTVRATTLQEFIALRFVSGLGAGAVLASQATLTAEYSPERYRSLAVALVTAGYPLGAMMTSVAAGFVMPEHGWRGMFFLGGAMTLLMAIVAWLAIPESLKYLLERRPPDALERINKILLRLRKSPLRELPVVSGPASKDRATLVGNMGRLLSAQHRMPTMILWITFFLCFSALYFLMSWIPRLLEQSGFAAEVGRQAFFQFNLGGVVGTVLMGTMAIRWRLTNVVSSFLLGAAILMVVFASLPGGQGLLVMLTFLIGFLLQGGFIGLYAVAAKVYPTEIRSTGVGWAIGLGRLGAVFGPAAAGFLIAAGLNMSQNYYVFAVPIALGGFMAYWLRVR